MNRVLQEVFFARNEKKVYKVERDLPNTMPNQRAKGQKAVIVMMDERFLAQIDRALPAAGMSDRSSLIREAVYRELNRLQIPVPKSVTLAPARAGKGGRPRKVVELHAHVAEEPETYNAPKRTKPKNKNTEK